MAFGALAATYAQINLTLKPNKAYVKQGDVL
jgi:hypothetical protein